MSSKDSRKRTVLITGCSPGGIGNGLARAFHSRGFHVLATARTTEAIADLAALGMNTLPLTVDSEESIQQCLTQTKKLCPHGLDYLVNNAGTNLTIPALDVDLDDARRCFETNFFAVVRMVQVFSPLLMDAKGTIVMIGSLAGEMPYVFGSIYNASKAALRSFTDTLRVELAQFDVKVINVITGGVRSRLTLKTPRFIPENSIYKPIEDDFNRRKLHSVEVGVSVDDYVADVIEQILPGSGPWPWRWIMKDARKRWIWAGSKSSLVWFLAGGWWRSGFFDWYFTRTFNLGKLRSVSKSTK